MTYESKVCKSLFLLFFLGGFDTHYKCCYNKDMIDNKNNNEVDMTFEDVIELGFKLAAEKGIKDPFDKSKYREIITAEKLEQNLFVGASGGKDNDETYGADATDADGNKVEYKSRKITVGNKNKGVLNSKYKFEYNGAYSKEIIAKYSNTTHVFTIYDKSKLIIAVKVPTDYVLNTLYKILEEKEKRRAKGEKVTTNFNSVSLSFNNGIPEIGEVIYSNNSWI